MDSTTELIVIFDDDYYRNFVGLATSIEEALRLIQQRYPEAHLVKEEGHMDAIHLGGKYEHRFFLLSNDKVNDIYTTGYPE